MTHHHEHECQCNHNHDSSHECECERPHETVEIDDALAALIEDAIAKAIEGFEKDGQFVPFTMLVVDGLVNIETHPGESEECFDNAHKTISASSTASMYAFCYDGFIGSDDGDLDAIIVEAGIRGEDHAIAACNLYKNAGDSLSFEEEII